MNVLSLFDGMSCGQIALRNLNINVDNFYASEIDKYAIKVTQKNFPDTIQLGDVMEIKGENLPKIDLLMGGSPCQGFSFAGKMLNFDDPRSKLFFEFVRLKNELNPKYFLLENVKMKKEYENIISDQLGVKPVHINSSLVSAQNRNRLYWTNIPNIEQPTDRKITWGSVREHGVNIKSHYYTKKAMQWLARTSRKKIRTLDIHLDSDKMQMIEASHSKKYSNQRFFGIPDIPSNNDMKHLMLDEYLINRFDEISSREISGLKYDYVKFGYDKIDDIITTLGEKIIPFTKPHRLPNGDFFFRYITPIECERLQNVPDNYTDCVSNTQRYKMLGNGWTVGVIEHIFKNIKNDYENISSV